MNRVAPLSGCRVVSCLRLGLEILGVCCVMPCFDFFCWFFVIKGVDIGIPLGGCRVVSCLGLGWWGVVVFHVMCIQHCLCEAPGSVVFFEFAASCRAWGWVSGACLLSLRWRCCSRYHPGFHSLTTCLCLEPVPGGVECFFLEGSVWVGVRWEW